MKRRIPPIEEIRKERPVKTVYDPFSYIPAYIAPYFVKLFLYTPITANQLTLLSYLLYILSAFFIATNQHMILALILLQVVILLDYIDGALARVKKQTSFLGLYLEYIFHETGPAFIFFALGSYLYKTLNSPLYLYLGALIILASLAINSFGTSKQRIMHQHLRKTGKIPADLVSGESVLADTKNSFLVIIYNMIDVLSNVPFSTYVITFGYIFGFLKYVLFYYFIYFCLIAIFKFVRELIIEFKPYGLK